MRHILMILVIISLAAALHPAYAQEEQRAVAYVDEIGKQVLTVLNSAAPEEEKQKQFRQLFSDNVDIPWMGQFVLGRVWADANEDQRSRYLSAYRDYLLAKYTHNFTEYAGSNYRITGARKQADSQYMVNMQVESPNANAQSTLAGYRVRIDHGQFKIIDIIIEGISLITTQRSEFTSAVQSGGIDQLISQLQQKTSNMKTTHQQ